MVAISAKKKRANAFAAQSRHALYLINFLFSLHVALLSYYLSTFLVHRGFPNSFIGILFAVGSMIALIAIAYAPRALKTYGNYTNLLALGLLEILAFVSLIYAKNLLLIFFLFLIIFVVPTLIAYSLDIFLKGSSNDTHDTGGIRGIFLTVANVAWIGAPLVGGILVAGEHFERLFFVSILIFIPFIFLSSRQLHHFRDPKYEKLNVTKFMGTLRRDVNLRNIFLSQFLLRFFFSIMVIYFPLYIHEVLLMPLSSIGTIIAIATLAYVILEIPLGRMLDSSYWSTKQVLILGFAIIAVTTAALSFITAGSLLMWALLMFITRTGAAMIEVASESYFFKHVAAADTDDVSAFRMLSPLAYIVSPLFGTLVLFFIPLQFIFLAAACVMLTGILCASQIHEGITK